MNSRQAVHLSMLLPRRWRPRAWMPFHSNNTQYFYLARNAVYSFVEQKLNGAEVLFPAYCHGVELEALIAAGAFPKFYPVRADMRVDIEDITRLIGPNTRAVYVIHYLGFPTIIDELRALCRDRGLLLIEDCALSLLSHHGGTPLGAFGDAAIFCLYKTLPLPHGGALYVPPSSDYVRPHTTRPSWPSSLAYSASSIQRHYRAQGRQLIADVLERLREKKSLATSSLDVRKVAGAQLNLADVRVGMGDVCRWIVTSLDLDAIVDRRRANYARLRERLREFAPPVFAGLPDGVCPLFYPLRVRDKDRMLRALRQADIEGVSFWSVHPKPIPVGLFPEADDLRRTILELPCHQDLTIDDMDHIADVVMEARRELAAVQR